VGRLLRKLGMSPQRPLHRAYQQNPEAVDRWKREEYPAIQAQAEAAGATVWFADEAGMFPIRRVTFKWCGCQDLAATTILYRSNIRLSG